MMRACLFDFDGTLVDTKADIVASLARAFERCGILFREFPAEIVMQLQLRDAIAALAPETTVDKQEKIIAAFTDIYDTGDYPNTTLMPTVTDLLDEMKARSIKPFIVTNKRLAPTLFLLDKFKLRHLFGDVYAPDMVFGKRKTKIELLNDIIDAYRY
jgi:phosphoglycolate phosphatase-like HAD superfamily hydrolase